MCRGGGAEEIFNPPSPPNRISPRPPSPWKQILSIYVGKHTFDTGSCFKPGLLSWRLQSDFLTTTLKNIEIYFVILLRPVQNNELKQNCLLLNVMNKVQRSLDNWWTKAWSVSAMFNLEMLSHGLSLRYWECFIILQTSFCKPSWCRHWIPHA